MDKEKQAAAGNPAAEPTAAPAREKKPKPERVGKTAELEAKLAEAEAKLAELQKELAAEKDAELRRMAEFDNYKKRTAREKEALAGEATAAAVKKLLPVLDNLERAEQAGGDAETLHKGVEMTLRQFTDALDALGVTEIEAGVGTPLDPNLHNAMMRTENAELPEGSITGVLAKGYRLGDRVIRHTMVQSN